MIVFDLRCGGGHVFEAWFGSSAAYTEQRESGLVACPICGDVQIEKAVMAPNVSAKSNQTPSISPSEMKVAMEALAAVQAKVLEKSTWVGGAFAGKARAMHLGEEPVVQIHGQATVNEVKELVEEGIDVTPLPLPVVPPETCN